METCSNEIGTENHVSSGNTVTSMTEVMKEKPRQTGGVESLVGALSPERAQVLPGEQVKQRRAGGLADGGESGNSLASGHRSPEAFLISHHLGNQIGCVCIRRPFTLQEKVLKTFSSTS